MFIAAVAHIYSFPHHPFHNNSPQYWNNPDHNWWRAFLSMMDITDMQEDVSEHLGVVTSSISRRFQGRSNYQPLSRGVQRRLSSENEYLINKRQDSDGSSQLLMVADDFDDTGRRKYYNTTKQQQANRYGATDNLVVPIYDDAQLLNSNSNNSQFQQAGSSNIRPKNTNNNSNNSNIQTSSQHFGGISIQKREIPSKDNYNSHHYAGAPAVGGNNYLQARNVGGAGGGSNNLVPISPISESGDDLISLGASSR